MITFQDLRPEAFGLDSVNGFMIISYNQFEGELMELMKHVVLGSRLAVGRSVSLSWQ